MNKQQSFWLLDETFNKDFDTVRFSGFLKELLNTSNLYAQDKTRFISNEFKDYILKVIKIGQYKDINGKKHDPLQLYPIFENICLIYSSF